MMTSAIPLIAAALALATGTASAQKPATPRGYAATYDARTGRYCIRFFSDTLLDPRPNNPAPDCRTRAGWARQKVTVRRRGRDEAAR